MMTFENNREAYCARFPDPRCNSYASSPLPAPSGFHAPENMDQYPEVTYLQGEIARIRALIDGTRNPRTARQLNGQAKRLEAQLKKVKRKLGLSGALAGLEDLSDMSADIPAVIDTATKGIVNVVNAIKPQPKPLPAPTPQVMGMDWQTLALYAGAVIGGVYLLKQMRKR